MGDGGECVHQNGHLDIRVFSIGVTSKFRKKDRFGSVKVKFSLMFIELACKCLADGCRNDIGCQFATGGHGATVLHVSGAEELEGTDESVGISTLDTDIIFIKATSREFPVIIVNLLII